MYPTWQPASFTPLRVLGPGEAARRATSPKGGGGGPSRTGSYNPQHLLQPHLQSYPQANKRTLGGKYNVEEARSGRTVGLVWGHVLLLFLPVMSWKERCAATGQDSEVHAHTCNSALGQRRACNLVCLLA